MWTDKDREKYKADGRRYPSDLTDAEWDIIKPLFQDYFTLTADVPGLLYFDRRYARDGERLFLPGAYRLPLAISPDRLRCASDGTHVVWTGFGPTACGRMPPHS